MMKRINLFSQMIGLMFLTLLSACASSPERIFDDQDLLVDISVMPENWGLLEIYTMDNEEGEDSGKSIIFYKTDTPYLVRAGQDVFHYSSTYWAGWHYRRLEKVYFSENSPRHTPWRVPEDFAFNSLIADQWQFGCTDSTFSPAPEFGDSSTICQYFAQYDEFLLYVTMTIRVNDQDMASMTDVYRFIEAIDQRMTQHLAP